MKIKRDKEKKEKTEEEKKLDVYRKAKNIGLAAMGTGLGILGLSAVGRPKVKEEHPTLGENLNDKSGKINLLRAAGIGLSAAGLGLHGISAVKYNTLKRKLKKEREENDNPEKKD